MSTSDNYKRQIMKDLAAGNQDAVADDNDADLKDFQNFDDFSRRSSRDQRRKLFRRSFNKDRVPANQMEPELRQAIDKIQPNERDDVAKEFLSQLKKQGLSDRDLESQLGLSTRHPDKMTAEDVSKLASFAYHSHPNVFQDVLAEQPALVRFLSNPLVGAALGAIAAKWLGNRH